MKIQIKRVYEPRAEGDGRRVLVDRLWPRGLSKEEADIDAWIPEVAPSLELRKWFGHKPERFETFAERYREELRANSAAIGRIREVAPRGPLTLVYSARDPEHNNAVVLRDFLSKRH